MTRIFLLLLIALMCAPAAFSQNKDYSYYEFYVGYAYERVDNDAGTFNKKKTQGATVNINSDNRNYNGFMAEFNQNVTRHVGIVTSFSGTYQDSRQRYDLMIGPRYNWRGEGVTPFVHGLFGVSHVRAEVADRTRSATAFAMAFGGGLDVHAGDHVDVRVIQVDYLPTFFNGKRQDNIRASAGIKIK